MINTVKKAANNEVLTPVQRALLRLAKSLIIAMIVAMLAVLIQALATGKVVDATVIYSALMAGGYAVLQGAQKFFSAIGDKELAGLANEGEALVNVGFSKLSGGMKLDDMVQPTDVSEAAKEFEDAIGVPEQPEQEVPEAQVTQEVPVIEPEQHTGVNYQAV